MKALIRKIRTVKKRKLIKNAIGTCTAAWALRHGSISHKTEPSPFFVNYNSSNQHVERPHQYQQVMIVDDENQSSIDNPSIHRVKLGSGITLISKEVNKKQNQIYEPLKSTITQKSELTYSQDEIDALGLGEVNKEVSLVVGLPMPHSSQSTEAVHEKNWNRLIQESNIPINMEQLPKIVMSRTSGDLTNQKWIKEFICSLRAGSDEEIDEALIKSILGKVAESELDVPSINKILKSIANATLSVASNQKLMRILAELQKPIPQSPLTVTPSTEVIKVPAKLEEYQQESKSSSSILAEAWMPELPRHRSADFVKRFGHQEVSNSENRSMPDSNPGSSGKIETLGESDEEDSTPTEAPKPSPPTGKLTKQAIQNNDATTKVISPIEFNDWEGESRIIKSRELKKTVFAKGSDAGVVPAENLVPCPVQKDPAKFQRKKCGLITDQSVEEMRDKLINLTTSRKDGRVKLQLDMPFYDTEKATAYLDINTGDCAFYHEDSGKYWSYVKYINLLANSDSVKYAKPSNSNSEL